MVAYASTSFAYAGDKRSPFCSPPTLYPKNVCLVVLVNATLFPLVSNNSRTPLLSRFEHRTSARGSMETGLPTGEARRTIVSSSRASLKWMQNFFLAEFSSTFSSDFTRLSKLGNVWLSLWCMFGPEDTRFMHYVGKVFVVETFAAQRNHFFCTARLCSPTNTTVERVFLGMTYRMWKVAEKSFYLYVVKVKVKGRVSAECLKVTAKDSSVMMAESPSFGERTPTHPGLHQCTCMYAPTCSLGTQNFKSNVFVNVYVLLHERFLPRHEPQDQSSSTSMKGDLVGAQIMARNDRLTPTGSDDTNEQDRNGWILSGLLNK